MNSSILLLFLLLGAATGECQSVELRAGQSLIPGDYVAISYQQPTNYPFRFSVRGFLEKSRKRGLNYSAIGGDVLIDFPFGICKFSAGPTIHFENEPWIYSNRSFSQRLNYGVVTECSGELYLTDSFSMTAFVNQKILFKKDLSNTHFIFGIGIKYSFSNY